MKLTQKANDRSMKSKLKGIYAVSPDIDVNDAQARRRFLERSELLLDAGLAMFQFRNKSPDSFQKDSLLKECRQLCSKYHCLFIVNDDLDLARRCQADGIHLGQGDGSVANVRKAMGAEVIIGVSCHGNLVLAEAAVHEGADYIAFGRFFPSKSKPDAPPADIRVLQQAKNRFDVPIVAIGGITEENAEYVIHAGADIVAMIDGLYSSKDLTATINKLQALFGLSHQPRIDEPVSS